MATKQPKTEVAVAAAGAVSLMSDQLPDFMREKMGQSARGSENVTSDDLVIPRLEIVQSLSPARKRNDPGYIEGAEEGMLYNNVTRQLYGASVFVIPVFFRKEYCIFKDRKQGGGFRGAFGSELEAKQALKELDDAEHCEVVDMAQHFCLLANRETGKTEEIVMSMSKTKLKVSRKWNSLIRMTDMDSFARVYEVSGISEKNANNQDFFNFSVVQKGFSGEGVYKVAEKLYEAIKAGQRQVNRDTVEEDLSGQPSGEY